MKKPFLTAIFSCILTGLLTSFSYWKVPENVFFNNSAGNIEHDSTGRISLLKVDSFNLAILPPSSGIQFYKNGIVFLSLSKNEAKMLSEHLSFGALEPYYAIPGDSVLGPHMIFSPGSSFSYPCESMTFSNDFNTMFFSKFPGGDKKEKIFMAKYVSNGKKQPAWIPDKTALDFCTAGSTYSHPALSADENMLIFASDMEGSYGGMDLFISRKNGGKWSPAENVGNLINSTGNDFFPSLDSDNNLFFSSDVVTGNGGFDIYTCRFNGETWDKPVNLSAVINSPDDDIAFTINRTDGRTAFFTRRQKAEKEKMQLFRITMNSEAADNNINTISSVFYGKHETAPHQAVEKTIPEIKPEEKKPAEPEIKPEEKKPAEPGIKVILPDTVKVVPAVINENNTGVVYRVQFLTSTVSKGKFQVTVANTTFDAFEYFYKGSYRYTAGRFSTLSQAVVLQNECRKSGYPEAFVVAFKNDIRSLDPLLFK
jgi:hypothetical protein